jgi:hypothetical protein
MGDTGKVHDDLAAFQCPCQGIFSGNSEIAKRTGTIIAGYLVPRVIEAGTKKTANPACWAGEDNAAHGAGAKAELRSKTAPPSASAVASVKLV